MVDFNIFFVFIGLHLDSRFIKHYMICYMLTLPDDSGIILQDAKLAKIIKITG